EFLLGKSDSSPRDEYFYYTGCLLTGVRSGKWKLVLPRVANPAGTGWWGRMIEAVPEVQLFDLENDPGEAKNVAGAHPQVVEELMVRIGRARAELGDIGQTGTGARFFEKGPRRLQVPVKEEAGPAPVKPKYDRRKPLGSLRFTFESGTLEGWKVVEGKLGEPVSGAVSLPRWKHKPFNREGKFHLSTIATGKGPSDRQTGVLESPPFALRGDRASFLVSGGYHPATLYVALCDAATGEVLHREGGPEGPRMHRVYWDVTAWKGMTVRLRIVDRNTGGWGHLCFDDFSVEGELVKE
ncbi:MAG: hypothetical protein GWO24_29860, partial [Akkermansiaceae bacterium]|nr:hypothetical protein [Akkermansiaceae bacterium]